MERTSGAGRRTGRTWVVAVTAALTLAGCSSSADSDGAAASCAGVIVMDGHRYHPWPSRHAVHLTGRVTRAGVPACPDADPGSRRPRSTQRVQEILGIDPAVAVAGMLIEGPPQERRIVYVRDEVPGHGGALPSALEELVSPR